MTCTKDIEKLTQALKEDIENNLIYENAAPIQIKIEEEVAAPIQNLDTDDPYESLRMEIKQEINHHMEQTETVTEDSGINESDMETRDEETTTLLNKNLQIEVKEEMATDETLLPHDYSNYDTVSMNSVNSLGARSMDSYEALGNVEACLQDDVNVKCESGVPQNNSVMKLDPDAPTTSTDIISTLEGMPKNILVHLPNSSINEEEILSDTTDSQTLDHSIVGVVSTVNNDNTMEDPDLFQLNSITGNVLSLEQEAYGLLKAKRKKVNNGQNGYYVCTECPKTYTRKSGLQRHYNVHRSIERRALGYAKSLQTKKDKLKKYNLEKKNKEKRNKSKKNQNSKVQNSKLQNSKVQNSKAENSKKEIVSENPQTEAKMEGYKCTCGNVFRRRIRMETCLRSHDLDAEEFSTFTCVTCLKSFKSKDELALHRKRLHRKRFPCKFCPTYYDTRKLLIKHLQIHQKVQLLEYKVVSEVMKGNKKLKCFMCSKNCTDLSEMKMHVLNDHKEPYVCPLCKKTCGKIIEFANHTKKSHPEVEGQSVLEVLETFSKLVKAWKCQECDLQFLEADKLARHQVEKHSPELKAEPQFQCPDCKRVFISQKGLTSHTRIHHSTETEEEAKEALDGIMCLECRKICKDMNALTSHMRFHSPDRKYPCKFCDFRFATPEKRKAHAEIHTGDMKYVCFICEYQCSSENRLKSHKMSLKHANMKEYLLTGKPLLEEPASTSKEDSGSKSDTKKKESSSKKRKKTEDVVEEKDSESSSSDSEVECDICGERFSSESEMLEHKQTHPFIEFPNEDTPTRIFFK